MTYYTKSILPKQDPNVSREHVKCYGKNYHFSLLDALSILGDVLFNIVHTIT